MEERFTRRSWEEWEYKLSSLADITRDVYLRGMKRFLEYYDLDTEQLYRMDKENLESNDPRDAKRVPRMVINYMKKLINEDGLKPATAELVFNSVKSFMKTNMLAFDANGEKPEVISEGKDRMTREQIITLLDACPSYRNKSIITMMKDTGLRESDIARIIVKNVMPVFDDPTMKFYTFSLRQKKTRRQADPVFGPDAVKYLRLWWNERIKLGIPKKPNSPLYCVLENKPKSVTKSGVVRLARRRGDKMTGNTIATMVRWAIVKAGLDDKNISGHSLRKTHETQLAAGGVPESWIDKMTGRATQGSKGVYVKPDETQLTEMYEKAYPYLSVSGPSTHELSELRMELDDTRDELQKQENNASIAMTAVKAILQSGEDKDRRIAVLEEELASQRKKLDDIYSTLLTENKIIGIDIPLEDKK